MIRSLATFAILMCSIALASAAEFTAAERSTVDQMAANTEAGCNQQMAAVKAKMAGQVQPAIAASMSVVNWGGYCSCVSQTLKQIVTPELLRTGNEQDGAAAMKRASTTCTVNRMKATFPAGCGAMVGELLSQGKGASLGEVTPAGFCKCADADVDALTADTFPDFARRTLSDYATYKRTGQIPAPTGPSLLATQQKCGMHATQQSAN